MLISLLIPCMNRTYALKQTLPGIIQAASTSPPVEIVVLNYSSTDDLEEYLAGMECDFLTIARIMGKKYYNSPHARNLAVLASHGEYIVQMSTEMILRHDFVSYIRERLETIHPVWMCEGYVGCVLVCHRDEFIAAGGYDERFEFYAPEDNDINARLHRRGGKFMTYPRELVAQIRTPNAEKIRNYNLGLFNGGSSNIKREMAKRMKPILDENNKHGVLVANPDGWGKWN